MPSKGLGTELVRLYNIQEILSKISFHEVLEFTKVHSFRHLK